MVRKVAAVAFHYEKKLLLQSTGEVVQSTEHREREKCSKCPVWPLPLLRCWT